MKNLKKLTILHSNDMHGDFLPSRLMNGWWAAFRCSPGM